MKERTFFGDCKGQVSTAVEKGIVLLYSNGQLAKKKKLLLHFLRMKVFESRKQRKAQHSNAFMLYNACITNLACFTTDNYAKYPFITIGNNSDIRRQIFVCTAIHYSLMRITQ